MAISVNKRQTLAWLSEGTESELLLFSCPDLLFLMGLPHPQPDSLKSGLISIPGSCPVRFPLAECSETSPAVHSAVHESLQSFYSEEKNIAPCPRL